MNATHAPVVSATVSTKVIRTTPTTRELDAQLAHAIDLACTRNIEVIAKGHRLSDGAKIYFTTSGSDAQRWHTVAVEGRHLRCDCAAGRYSQHVCSHRAAVYMHLVVSAAERDLAARQLGGQMVRDALQASSEAPTSSSFGPPSPEHPQLADDGRGFSLYK